MTPATFLDQFATFVEAPNGVARLRELILQLAVLGKLVPQDPNDEPADIESDSDIDRPFDIPSQWRWGLVEQVAESRLGKMLDNAKNKGTPKIYLRNTNVHWMRFDLSSLKEMPFEDDELDEFEVRRGDVLICEGGHGIGRTAVWDGQLDQVMFQKALHRVRPSEQLDGNFFTFCMRVYDAIGILQTYYTGAGIPHLTGRSLAKLLFPVPPLAEQRRIVAKVDQLLGLCDELASRQEARRAARERLVVATLDRLTSPGPAAESASRAKRLQDHFDILFDIPTTIPHLRQAILQLAVQGQLVPQDPNDEPINELVARVGAVRRQFEKTSPARQRNELAPIEADELSFEPPTNWQWIRFGELANIAGGVTLGRKLDGQQLISFSYLRVANVQQGRLELSVIKEVQIPIDELPKYRLEIGDVLLTEGGDWDKLGRSAIWNGEIENCLHQNHIFRARPFTDDVQSRWLTLFTNSPVGRSYFQSAAKQTTNLASINITQLRNCPIPLPPLAEQKRIVAKVTELLSLCDALESQLQSAESASTQLLSASVSHLLQGL